MCLLQIIVQVAIKAARPTMDASTPEPLKRLIAKCWAQVPEVFSRMHHKQRGTAPVGAVALVRSQEIHPASSVHSQC